MTSITRQCLTSCVLIFPMICRQKTTGDKRSPPVYWPTFNHKNMLCSNEQSRLVSSDVDGKFLMADIQKLTETHTCLIERFASVLHIWNSSTNCVCVCVCRGGYKTGRTECMVDEMFIYTCHKTHTYTLSAFHLQYFIRTEYKTSR